MVTPFAAIQAYSAAQSAAKPAGLGGMGDIAAGGEVSGGGFGQMLSNVMNQAVQQSHAAEAQMANHAAGKAELIDVVTAISSAEASLETVMAVRDQVIQAYQEIARMPI